MRWEWELPWEAFWRERSMGGKSSQGRLGVRPMGAFSTVEAPPLACFNNEQQENQFTTDNVTSGTTRVGRLHRQRTTRVRFPISVIVMASCPDK